MNAYGPAIVGPHGAQVIHHKLHRNVGLRGRVVVWTITCSLCAREFDTEEQAAEHVEKCEGIR